MRQIGQCAPDRLSRCAVCGKRYAARGMRRVVCDAWYAMRVARHAVCSARHAVCGKRHPGCIKKWSKFGGKTEVDP